MHHCISKGFFSRQRDVILWSLCLKGSDIVVSVLLFLFKAEENLIIPIHAYPVMNTDGFPREVHFPLVPLGEK